jgi:hypothetical protein
MAQVLISGLSELVRGFSKLGSELRPSVREQLREIADEVATEAKSVASGQGLVRSGRLVGQIKPSVRGTSAYVRATARNRGFPYPAIYEGTYKLKRPSGGRTVRKFLEPALDAKQGEIEPRIERMLDRLAAGAGF